MAKKQDVSNYLATLESYLSNFNSAETLSFDRSDSFDEVELHRDFNSVFSIPSTNLIP